MRIQNGRVGTLEQSRIEYDARAAASSIRVKTVSENDLKQESVIGGLLSDVEAIKTNQVDAAKEREATALLVKDVHTTVVGVIKNPKVVFVGKLIFTTAVAYAGLKGIKVLP